MQQNAGDRKGKREREKRGTPLRKWKWERGAVVRARRKVARRGPAKGGVLAINASHKKSSPSLMGSTLREQAAGHRARGKKNGEKARRGR